MQVIAHLTVEFDVDREQPGELFFAKQDPIASIGIAVAEDLLFAASPTNGRTACGRQLSTRINLTA